MRTSRSDTTLLPFDFCLLTFAFLFFGGQSDANTSWR
jgi:hypothetical protein